MANYLTVFDRLRRIRDCRRFTAKELGLLYTMALYGNADGENIFPGQKRLAADCGMAIRSLRRTQKQLEDDGIISCVGGGRGKGNAKEWRINWPDPKGDTGDPFSDPKGDTGDPFSDSKEDTGDGKRGHLTSSKGVTSVPPTGVIPAQERFSRAHAHEAEQALPSEFEKPIENVGTDASRERSLPRCRWSGCDDRGFDHGYCDWHEKELTRQEILAAVREGRPLRRRDLRDRLTCPIRLGVELEYLEKQSYIARVPDTVPIQWTVAKTEAAA